ncbi:helix-turn-helix domain-containing protein [Actinoplanes sp. NPDC051346]|uniref:helix-turn-helix domain-containing protein n=1 Tax=Actinoplanes sp. NPDC051346 TaxID=3155048 RepID=UPI0034412B16
MVNLQVISVSLSCSNRKAVPGYRMQDSDQWSGSQDACVVHTAGRFYVPQIMQLFAGGRQLTVGEVAVASGLGQSTTSEHLTVLRRGGLVTATRDGEPVRDRAEPLAIGARLGELQSSLTCCCPRRTWAPSGDSCRHGTRGLLCLERSLGEKVLQPDDVHSSSETVTPTARRVAGRAECR